MIFMTSIANPFRLPFDGRWFVAQGGDTINVNHHMAVQAQWYGIDFAKVGGPTGRTLKVGTGKDIKDFFSWDQAVFAPVAGTVVSLENSMPDNAIGVYDKVRVRGNHVTIRSVDGDLIILAHFQKGSLQVPIGVKVEAGDLLGRCGNSGNSDFPHIHLHVESTADIDDGQGKNIIFSNMDVELNGKKFERVEWPLIRGLFVQPSPKA